MKRFVVSVIVAFSMVVSAGHLHAQDFDRQAMLENLVTNIIVPNNQAFYFSTIALEEKTIAFSLAPNEETLTALQEAWKATALAWQPVSIIGFREVMAFNNRINKAPTKVDFIEKFITGDKVLDAEFISSVGSNSVGLPAIEYLVFDENGDNVALLNGLTNDQRRMEYLVALAQALRISAHDLFNFWSPDGEDFATTFIKGDQDGGDMQASINDIMNEMVSDVEVMAKTRLGAPLGIDDNEARPLQAEASRSDMGLQLIRANLLGVQNLYNGADGLGYDDYITSIAKTQEINTELNTQFNLAMANLSTIEQPLETVVVEAPDSLRVVYDNIKVVIRYFKVDVAQQLSISISFNDADGD